MDQRNHPRKNSSLNDCLENGDNYILHIFDILARFRDSLVGLTTDIEEAFLMVSIKEEDRNMVRFLWFDNIQKDRPKIGQFRFNRLLFGLRLSPSIPGEPIAHHLGPNKQSEPEMAALLKRSLYVDNLITGTVNDKNNVEIGHKLKGIMADGGFHLRRWNTNSLKVMSENSNSERPLQDSIAQNKSQSDVTIEDNQSYVKTTTGMDSPSKEECAVVKVLGLNWNTVSDKLFFDFSS